MALQIEQQTRDIGVVRTPIVGERTRVVVRPGDAFRFVDDTTGKPPLRAPRMRVRRIDNNLIIDGLPEGREVQLNNFFGACRPGAECTVSLEGIGFPGTPPITEESLPQAALQDGSFLLYADNSDATTVSGVLAATQVAQATGPSWFAIGAAGLGVLGAAAAAGGAGGGGASAAPTPTSPAAPLITSPSALKRSSVIVSGEGEPGARITLRVDVNGNGQFSDSVDLTYTTVVGADGRWRIDLNSTPQSGSLPAGGLADGTYSVIATATNSAPNPSPSTPGIVIIDGVPPTVPVIGTVGSNDVIAGVGAGGVSVSGTGDPGASIRVGWGSSTKTGTIRPDGTWSFVFAPGEVPAAGTSTVRAEASDAAGNTSAATRGVTVMPPAAPAVFAVTGDDIVNLADATTGVVVSGTAFAASTVQVSWGGTTLSSRAGTDGRFSVTFASTQVPADGAAVPVSATATDAAGNTGNAATRSVLVDTTPPAAPVFTTSSSTNLTRPLISGTAEAGSTVRLTLDANNDGSVEATWTLTAGPTGAWSVNTATTAPDGSATVFSGLTNNSLNGLRAVATDGVGNAGTARTQTLGVDFSAPPAPVFATTLAGDNVVNLAERNGGVVISGTLPDATYAGRPVTVTWGGVSRVATFTDGATGRAWSVTFSAGEVPADGTPTLTASYTSVSGRPSIDGVPTTALVVDTTPPAAPTLALTAASDSGTVGDFVTNVLAPTVRVSLAGSGASAAVAGDVVSLSVGASQVGSATLSGANVSAGFVDITVSPALTSSASPRTFSATVTDAAGNDSAAGTQAITLTTAAPTQTLSSVAVTDNVAPVTGSLANAASTNDATPSFTLTLGSALGADETLSLLRGGTTVATVGTGTTLSFTEAGLADGLYSYSAVLTNAAGNTSTLDLNGASAGTAFALTIDTTAPAAPSVNLAAASDSGTVGDFITSVLTPTIRVSLAGSGATAAVAGDVVTLSLTGTTVGSATLNAGNISAGFVDITLGSPVTAGASPQTFSATITDAAGNVSTAGTRGITFDTTAPAQNLSVITVSDDLAPITGSFASGASTNDPTPTFSLTLDSVLLTGETLTLQRGASTVATATAGETTLTFTEGSALTDGTYSYTAVLSDAAGNSRTLDLNGASAGNAFSVVVDTTAPAAPSLNLTTASDTGTVGDFITSDTTPTVRVTLAGSGATAAVAGDTVALSVGASSVGSATLSSTNITNGFVDITTSTLTASASAQTFSATITDTAGNVSSAGTRSITISNDTTAPADPTVALAPVSVTGSAANTTNDTTPVIRVSFTNTGPTGAAAGDLVTLTAGATTLGTATLTSGDVSAQFVDIQVSSALTANATTTVSATIRDVVGNTSGAGTQGITVDTSPPTAPVGFSFSITNDASAAYQDISGSVTGATGNADRTPTLTLTLPNPIAAGDTLLITRQTLLSGSPTTVLTATSASASPVVVTESTLPVLANNDAYVYTGILRDAAGNQTILDIDGAGSDGVYIIKVA